MLNDADHFLPSLDFGLVRQVIVQYLQREPPFEGTKFIPVSCFQISLNSFLGRRPESFSSFQKPKEKLTVLE